MQQSWQTDLVNLWLSASFKPMLRLIGSVHSARALVRAADLSVGRLSLPLGIRRTEVAIPRARFASEWINACDAARKRVILYLPGGAFVIRMPNAHAAMVSRLCRAADAQALIAHYRLAPEHPFPACLDDALLAYRWLLDEGISPDRIAIAGDSAGGGLTLSTLLAIRDEGLPLPACGYLMSPLLDVSDRAASRWQNAASDAALPPPHQRGFNPRPLYAGDHALDDPLLSPLFGDLRGLPPLYAQVSDSEMLLDDSLRLARRGHTYQVDVKVDVWRKAPHVWQVFPFLPESADALDKAGTFLRRCIS